MGHWLVSGGHVALLIRLPLPAIAAFGGGVIALHNLLDRVNPAVFGRFAPLWTILHGYGPFWIVPGKSSFFVLWPLVPWGGVTAVGYAMGYLLSRKNWRTRVFAIGTALTITFAVLRAFHWYGNSDAHLFGVAAGPWAIQATLPLTVASFFDTLKYPASLQFLLMTMGPALMGDLHGSMPSTRKGGWQRFSRLSAACLCSFMFSIST